MTGLSEDPQKQIPFRFEREIGRQSFVDRANGLRLELHQWPEYSFSVSVEPVEGEQAQVWPLSERAYFEFLIGSDPFQIPETLPIKGAFPRVPFGRDYPGRCEELLDVVIPIVCEVASELSGILPRTYGPVSDAIRSRLLAGQGYSRTRDESI